MAEKQTSRQMVSIGADDLSVAGSEIRKITAEVLDTVHKRVSAGLVDGGPPRLFFPNGIELIDVTISLGLQSKGLEIKVKLAGEKGVKNLVAESLEGRLPQAELVAKMP